MDEEFEESDDDGVIFKGSQLYSSLVNTGSLACELSKECLDRQLKNAGMQSYSDTLPSDSREPVTVQPPKSRQSISPWRRWLRRIKHWCLEWLGFNEPHKVLQQSQHWTLPVLLSTSLLEPDDAEFLDAYVSCTSQITTSGLSAHSSLHSCLMLMVLAPSLCAYVYLRCFNLSCHWCFHPVTDTLAVIALSCALIKGANTYRTREATKCIAERVEVFKSYLQMGESCLQMGKKCLRLVQEIELVSRGFTLVSQRNPLSRLEVGGSVQSMIQRQCPTLRKLIFTTARETVHYYRKQTKLLFTLYPVSSMFDVENMFVAFESLQSYGPCLQQDGLDSDQLYEFTDGFSVASLKAICQLLNLHQSEFIKALSLVNHLGCKPTDDIPLTNIVKEITTHLEAGNQSLQQCYDYHRCSITSHGEPASRKHPRMTQLQDIYVAVHSLDLHLQAALNRVRSLSSWIEKQEAQDNTLNLSHNLIDELMQPIRAELESCKGCWEEGLNRMEKTLKTTDKSDPFVKTTNADLPVRDDTIQSRLVDIEDYIIEDQVFEAYTDPTEQQLDSSDWGICLTMEEKERKRREKQEALRMLSELKTVISVRAVETVKREQAALSRRNPKLTIPESLLSDEQIPTNTREGQTIDPQNCTPDVQRLTNSPEASPNDQLGLHLIPHGQINDQQIPTNPKNGPEFKPKRSTYNPQGLVNDQDETISVNSSLKNENLCKDSEGNDKISSKQGHGCAKTDSYNELEDNVKVLVGMEKIEHPGKHASQAHEHNNWHKSNVSSLTVSENLEKKTDFKDKQLDESEMLQDLDSDTCGDMNDHMRKSVKGDCIGDEEHALNDRYSEIKSIVTNLGVRRLRKSRMLDDMDSDSDVEQSDAAAVKDSIEITENLEQKENEPPKIGLPHLTKSSQHFTTGADKDDDDEDVGDHHDEDGDVGDHHDEDGDVGDHHDEDVYPEMKERTATLEERLVRIAGVNLGLSANIAAIAAARSKDFGHLTEDTFGGEVFGELSDSDSETELKNDSDNK